MSNFQQDKIKIRDFIHKIECGKYQLPCFQRDFKWNPPKIKSLLNSVQHFYPAGSLLFLNVDRDNPLIPYQPFKYANQEQLIEKPEALVLDGQQRMTSCFSVFKNLGYYTYYIDFIKLMEDYNQKYKDGMNDINSELFTDFDFENYIVHKRHSSTPMAELANGLFPMTFLIDRNTMRNQIKTYISGVESDPGKKVICDFLNYDFEGIVDTVLDYEFPVVKLPDNSSMQAVCKVFQTINTSGLRLSVFDICVAVFMPKNVNLKKMVEEASDSHDYSKLLLKKDATPALQVIALLANKTPNSNTLASVLEADDIIYSWDDAIDGIEQAMEMFDGFGAGTKKSLSLLPYSPMVTIIAAVLAKIKYSTLNFSVKAKIENKIKKYFYTVSLALRYTEGTNKKMYDDFKNIMKWINEDTVPLMISNGVNWNTDKIVDNNKSGAFGKAILSLLNSKKPTDFYRNQSVGVGESIESCDLHHIFPKATYENKYKEKINSVFNFTWLKRDTNQYIQDDTTTEYINKIITEIPINEDELKSILDSHIINSDLYELLKKEDYMAFITKRAECFKKMLKDIGVNFIDVAQDDIEVDNEEEEE